MHASFKFNCVRLPTRSLRLQFRVMLIYGPISAAQDQLSDHTRQGTDDTITQLAKLTRKNQKKKRAPFISFVKRTQATFYNV